MPNGIDTVDLAGRHSYITLSVSSVYSAIQNHHLFRSSGATHLTLHYPCLPSIPRIPRFRTDSAQTLPHHTSQPPPLRHQRCEMCIARRSSLLYKPQRGDPSYITFSASSVYSAYSAIQNPISSVPAGRPILHYIFRVFRVFRVFRDSEPPFLHQRGDTPTLHHPHNPHYKHKTKLYLDNL